jgi:hypothetical protein
MAVATAMAATMLEADEPRQLRMGSQQGKPVEEGRGSLDRHVV